MDKFIKFSLSKAVGLFIVASAVGLAVVAKAADVLPDFSMPHKVFAGEFSKGFSDRTSPEQLRLFSMEVLNDAAIAEKFEISLVERGSDVKATLRIKPVDQDGAAEEYEMTVAVAEFAEFWMRLRELDVEQLTNLSPTTENIGRPKRFSAVKTKDSSSYRFKFQDGVDDYPNSFDVYSPDELQDARYRKLRDLATAFVLETFGDDILQ